MKSIDYGRTDGRRDYIFGDAELRRGICEKLISLMKESGYKYVIDIIDYFSKYMGSFPVSDNNGKNALLSIKEFCIYIGFPKILQTDNGPEYCNNLIDTFCAENNIKHITILPAKTMV